MINIKLDNNNKVVALSGKAKVKDIKRKGLILASKYYMEDDLNE